MALASICRMRSRVTQNCWPTSSSVWSAFMPMPKRMRSTRSSRGVREASTRVVVSRRFDWTAQTGEYGDLTSQGVIDPAKVVRCALQDASSIAGLLITTEAMVAERPKKEAAHAPMPHGAMDY